MTNQKQIRAAFWDAHYILAERAREAGILTAPQNRHNAQTRAAFVDFVDALARLGTISEALAFRATL